MNTHDEDHSELFGLINCCTIKFGFPPLPIELVRIILEVAAADNRSFAVTLSLVSKDVRSWIKPILYHTVVLSTSLELTSFYTVTLRSDPTVAQLVTNLFLRSTSTTGSRAATNILDTCNNVKRLVIVNSSFGDPSVDEKPSWPKLWEIVYIVDSLAWLRATHPSLSHVTHFQLDALFFSSTISSCLIPPCLTHLGMTQWKLTNAYAVYDEHFVQYIRQVLSTSTTLEMLLIQLQPAKGVIGEGLVGPYDMRPSIWTDLVNIADERLLASPALDAEEYLTVLESGRTIWDDASVKFAGWRTLALTMSPNC